MTKRQMASRICKKILENRQAAASQGRIECGLMREISFKESESEIIFPILKALGR